MAERGRLEDQEAAVHALHLLQFCLVYVNTLMLQRLLSEASYSAGEEIGLDLGEFLDRLGS